MLDHLKKDRRVGLGAQERFRLALYVAGMIAIGGFIVIGATGKKAPRPGAGSGDATPAVTPDPRPRLDPVAFARLVEASGAEPERYSREGIEHLRKLQRKGSWGEVRERVTPEALLARGPAGLRGELLEVEGRVIDVTREAYQPAPGANEQRLWSVVLEGSDGATVVALKYSLRTNQDEGPPTDAKPPLLPAERIAPGQDVIVRGVYLQQRTGTIGETVLRAPTPVLFCSDFRIELPPEERLPPIPSLDKASWDVIEDRFNRESRRWDDDAVFEVIRWARERGYEACRDDVLNGPIGWKPWGKQVFERWKKEVAVTADDPRPITEGSRGKVFRFSGMVGEVFQYGWERIPRNPWGVDQMQSLTLLSDHYRNVALRLILPFPVSTFPSVQGAREEHLRVYGVFVKNHTYDTRHKRPDGSERDQPITVPMFVVLHAEPYPIDEAGRPMRTLMYWVAGAMVLLALVFYFVLIRGGQRQAERMEAHRWALRKRARESEQGKDAGAPSAADPPPGADGEGDA
jgi:hypothetical protein